MKRRDLERHLHNHGCREIGGSKHAKWRGPQRASLGPATTQGDRPRACPSDLPAAGRSPSPEPPLIGRLSDERHRAPTLRDRAGGTGRPGPSGRDHRRQTRNGSRRPGPASAEHVALYGQARSGWRPSDRMSPSTTWWPRQNLQSDRSNLSISTTTTATSSTATGIRTPVSGLRIRRPSPLDDSGEERAF